MPLVKKLNCEDVEIIFNSFKDGSTVKSLAEQFGVTRLTVSRLLRGESYKDCVSKLDIATPEFFASVDSIMKENQRRSMGRGRKLNG